MLFGLCYGFTDSAFSLLTAWDQMGNVKSTRTQVALLNAGYTAGAAFMLIVVSAALKLGGTCYACFVALGALAALATIAMAACDFLPNGVPALIPSSSGGSKTFVKQPRGERTRAATFVVCMACVLFCATGSEHIVGTWLPAFGVDAGGLEPSTSAVVTSIYWMTICVGRVGWCLLSNLINSAWPILVMDAGLMMLAGVLYLAYATPAVDPVRQAMAASSRRYTLLVCASLLLGLGCASSLPCAVTMPTEAHIALTPTVLLLFNLAGTFGEMFSPFAMGLLLDRRRYRAFGISIVGLTAVMLSATALAWQRREPSPARD